MQKPLIILKFGTSTFVQKNGELKKGAFNEICRQIIELHKKYRIIIVSSGAVALGKNTFQNFTGTSIERKAAAALGNTYLIRKYSENLKNHNLKVAQILIERDDFSQRQKFINLLETCEYFWPENIIPVFNENDVLADLELKFSDNDELAVILSIVFNAEKLLLGTSAEGLLHQDKKLVKKIEKFNSEIFSLVDEKMKSGGGLGGMLSKLHCAKLATSFGVNVQIFEGSGTSKIIEALENKTGTFCPAQRCNISAHQKWMATGSLPRGTIILDKGAIQALNKNMNLLSVGVKKITQDFIKGDIIELQDKNQKTIGLARTKINSEDFQKEDKQVLARTSDIVLQD